MRRYPSYETVERICLGTDGRWMLNPLLFSDTKTRCDISIVERFIEIRLTNFVE